MTTPCYLDECPTVPNISLKNGVAERTDQIILANERTKYDDRTRISLQSLGQNQLRNRNKTKGGWTDGKRRWNIGIEERLEHSSSGYK